MAETEASIVTKPVFSAAFILHFFRGVAVSKHKVVPNIILVVAYFIAGSLSVHFNRSFDIAPALIWVPAGIALAGIILSGYAVVPGIFIGALLTGIMNGYPLPTLIGATIGNTLQPVLGAYLLKRFDFDPILSRQRDILALLIVVVLASLALPSISLSIVWFAGLLPLENFVATWGRVWVGNMLSILILTPLITCWILKPRLESKPLEIIERGAAFLVLSIILYGLFWTPTTQIAGVALVYLLLVPLFWIGLRFTPRWMTLALFIMVSAGLAGVAWQYGAGQPSPIPLGQRLYLVEVFMLVMGTMFPVLASVVQERRSATKALQVHVEQLQTALRRIQSEDEAKSEFLAILAHELRNPLALILSTLEYLKLRVPPKMEESSMLSGAEDRVHTMSRMLDDLLDMSRITQRTFELQKEPTALNTAFAHALQSTALVMQNRDHQFTISLPEQPISLLIDPVRFEQIIVNLLTNAAKYTNPGGAIELSGAVKNNTLEFRVKDNGIGIPSHLIDRIFEPFQQVSEKRMRTAGLGIGLSITKRLVEMHGGTIEVHSKGAGQGSEFIVHFPILAAHIEETGARRHVQQ